MILPLSSLITPSKLRRKECFELGPPRPCVFVVCRITVSRSTACGSHAAYVHNYNLDVIQTLLISYTRTILSIQCGYHRPHACTEHHLPLFLSSSLHCHQCDHACILLAVFTENTMRLKFITVYNADIVQCTSTCTPYVLSWYVWSSLHACIYIQHGTPSRTTCARGVA